MSDFDDLFAELEDVFASVKEEEIVDLTKQSVEALLQRMNEIDEWLKEHKQVIALNPDTQESRDVHAERAAIKIELNRRGF